MAMGNNGKAAAVIAVAALVLSFWAMNYDVRLSSGILIVGLIIAGYVHHNVPEE